MQSGERVLIVLGVNPSTADETHPDPTMLSVLRFVEAFGYSGFAMLNLSSERATNPNDLSVILDEEMHQRNLSTIVSVGKLFPDADILVAFGNNIEKREYLGKCFYEIYRLLNDGRRWLCIGGKDGLTKYGHPRHPLYASTKLGLGEFDIEQYASDFSYADDRYSWFIERELRSSDPNPEWRWCLVGNVVGPHPYGESGEERTGTKQFAPGAKVYCAPGQWGDGYEKIVVIGHPRRGKPWIEIVMPFKSIENFRVQKVFRPAVLDIMKQGRYRWWRDTDEDYQDICCLIRSIEEYRGSH